MLSSLFIFNENCHLILKICNDSLISGYFNLNSINHNSNHIITGGCTKLSNTSYELFFKVDWTDKNQNSYTLFSGLVFLKENDITKINLNWSFFCKTTKVSRFGFYKGVNLQNNSKFILSSRTAIPYPYNLSEQIN